MKEFFDVIISNGVLHHTENPKLAFIELTKYLKKGGYIVIGLYHRYGRIYKKISQFLINTFGNSFKFLDKKILDKNLSKEKQEDLRKILANACRNNKLNKIYNEIGILNIGSKTNLQ